MGESGTGAVAGVPDPCGVAGMGVGAVELIPHHSASVLQSKIAAISDSVGFEAIFGRRRRSLD